MRLAHSLEELMMLISSASKYIKCNAESCRQGIVGHKRILRADLLRMRPFDGYVAWPNQKLDS